jgi:hypothetical protein
VVTFDSEWARCAPFIAPALEHCHGNYELADVRELCLAGQMQLWPGHRCALVTQIIRWPRRTELNVTFAGGDLQEIEQISEHVKAWGKSKGCDHVTVWGRPGWVRALKQGEIFATGSRKEL